MPRREARAPIPRVAHVVWMQGEGHRNVAARVAGARAQWAAAGLACEFWDDGAVVALLRKQYAPGDADRYLSVLSTIVRADIARAYILHARGGVYADLDCAPTRHWGALLEELEAGRGDVWIAGSRVWGANNALIVSRRGAPFWDEFQRAVAHALKCPTLTDIVARVALPTWDVLRTAGPVAYARLAGTRGLRVLDADTFVSTVPDGGRAGRSAPDPRAWAVHTAENTWFSRSEVRLHVALVALLLALALAGIAALAAAAGAPPTSLTRR